MSETPASQRNTPDQRTWSARDILGKYSDLGVPHFQRGLVWNTESVSLLIESLFSGTPCGTLILWRPRDPTREGVPLQPGAKPECLVLDGQQRIRSLQCALSSPMPALGQEEEDEQKDEEAGEPSKQVWCVNLSRLPGMPYEVVGDTRFPLFALAKPTRNLVPLHLFFERKTEEILELAGAVLRPTLKEILRQVTDQMLGIMDNRLFHVWELVQSDGRNALADVVALYNRINSGGRRVEAEERAYAALVADVPRAQDWLAETFRLIHDSPESAEVGALQRDDLLERRKERNFGFKLFVRTLIQAIAYHCRLQVGSGSFSFQLLEKQGVRRFLADPAKTERLLETTRDVLVFVRDVLEDELDCDDLQMLPDTSSLWPVFQILFRYPGLLKARSEGRRAIAATILRLFLARSMNQRHILRLVEIADRSHSAKECLEKLDAEITKHLGEKDILKGLEAAQSLQDRYVLLLYWLLRKRKARDLSYKNLEAAKQRGLRPGSEAVLSTEARPEKQHIVPYSRLRKMFPDLRVRGRVSTHPANGVGNLTFISQRLNGGDDGLWDKAIDLRIEPLDNLRAHFLTSVDGLHTSYSEALGSGEAARRAFEKFCRIRRDQMGNAFRSWLDEVPIRGTLHLRFEPEVRLFRPEENDEIRKFGYPDTIEDAIIGCVGRGGLVRGSGRTPVYRPRASSRRRDFKLELQPSRIIIYERETPFFKKIEARLSDAKIPFEYQKISRRGKSQRRFWTLQTDDPSSDGIVQVLISIAADLAGQEMA